MSKVGITAMILVTLACVVSIEVAAGQDKSQAVQVVQRPRPAGWDQLVLGGRFMDFYQPMPDLGGVTSDCWGAPNVIPRDINNGIEDPKWSYWGGNTLLEADGKYHLLVCRWPEDAPKGHMSWPDSTVVHAVSETPYGPFKVADEIGPGHNPTWYVAKDGTYVLYVIDGRYTAPSINGPWTKSQFDYDDRDRKDTKQKNYLHNNTFAQRQDGSFLMVNRHGQAWFSKDGLSTYHRVSPERVYPAVEGKFEDPVIWRDNVQYHLIVNDWLGRIAWYLRSKDGVHWKIDAGEAYLPGIAVHATGVKEDWFKYERIRVLQDKHGRAYAANFAVIDVLKHSDLPNDNHSSKLTVIPMTVPRLIEVLGSEAITPETKQIRVKVKAEKGFDPHKDLDVNSLRFGASEEVSFGRGATVLRTESAGPDLVLVFGGQETGIGPDHFAGKLLGKTTEGKLLHGWSRLPGVDYVAPLLSARAPKFESKDGDITAKVEVQNFGQSASQESTIKLILKDVGGKESVVSGSVPTLKPFEKSVVQLDCGKFSRKKSSVTVELEGEGHSPEAFGDIQHE